MARDHTALSHGIALRRWAVYPQAGTSTTWVTLFPWVGFHDRPGRGGQSPPRAAQPKFGGAYVLKVMALAHSGGPAVVDSEEAWQRAHLPESFAKFVYTAG